MLAVYEKVGMRRVARAEREVYSEESFHIDLTNLWQTKTRSQERQYQAIKDEGTFSQQRTQTFLRFNYRNTEQGTYNYKQAHRKVKRATFRSNKSLKKGTMNVNDLWAESQIQQVMGSPAFPRDRLKILKIWAGKGAPRPLKIGTTMRIHTE